MNIKENCKNRQVNLNFTKTMDFYSKNILKISKFNQLEMT